MNPKEQQKTKDYLEVSIVITIQDIFLSFLLAESPPRDLQVTSYK